MNDKYSEIIMSQLLRHYKRNKNTTSFFIFQNLVTKSAYEYIDVWKFQGIEFGESIIWKFLYDIILFFYFLYFIK